MSSKCIIGIDPGKNGGIALITPDSQWIEIHPMPETEMDTIRLLDTLVKERAIKTIHVFIERVSAMPQQGVVSMFTFGRNYGFIRGALMSHYIRMEEVSPNEWQRGLGITPKKKDEDKSAYKKRLVEVAQRLFPGLKDINQKTADALLIAEYGQRIADQLRGKEKENEISA